MRINIDDWQEYARETTGSQVKKWLTHDGKLYLFKETKYRNDGTSIYNDVSECIASDVASLIGIDCAKYQLCTRNGVFGVITPDFLDNEIGCMPKREELTLGFNLINKIDPGFKNKWLENPKTDQLYTVSLILESVQSYNLIPQALEMIIYDLLIGNYDRNPSNWGIIKNYQTDECRFTPLYDNCTSLGISVNDKRLGNDIIETDGKPLIVNADHFKIVVHNHIISKIVLEKHFQKDAKKLWYETRKEQGLPNLAYDYRIMEYQPMIEYLTTFYPDEINSIMGRIKELVTEGNIINIIDNYKDELDVRRQFFAKSIVMERAKWMINYYEEKCCEREAIL